MDTRTKKIVTRNFITDGTDAEIEVPYGIAVNPDNGDFFVTDAEDYVMLGKSTATTGKESGKWSVTTGDIPAHIVFTRKRLRPLDEKPEKMNAQTTRYETTGKPEKQKKMKRLATAAALAFSCVQPHRVRRYPKGICPNRPGLSSKATNPFTESRSMNR